jgi:hypothetical protein
MSANLIPSLSKLFASPITNFWVEFNGYLLGKSTGTLDYTPEFDTKDIIYTQDGTKAEDHVYTGADHMVALTLSEKVNENLFSLLVPGWEHIINSGLPDSIITKNLYQSLRDTRGGVLRIIAALPDGSPSEDANDIITLYLAIPLIDSSIFKFGADQQQEMPVSFRCKTVRLVDIQGSNISSIVYNGKSIAQLFGYMGNPSSIGIPAAVVPDRSGPEVLSATVVSTTALKVAFNKDLDPNYFGQGFAFSGTPGALGTTWTNVVNGGIGVNLNGAGAIAVTGINLSTGSSYNIIASLIQAAVRAADPTLVAMTVVYNGSKNRFEFVSPTYGTSSTVALTAGTGTDLLGATLLNGATSVAGKNGLKTVTALTALVTNSEDAKFKLPASASINGVEGNEVDFVFAGGSFVAGDAVTIFLSNDLCADASGNKNQTVGLGTAAANTLV